MEKYYTSERSQQIVLALLKAHGIKKIIASPGTTNLTFVASAQQDSYFEMYSSVDERSAAYMACGMAAESGEPVVLSCTGATASRNYLPGLTEAYYRKLPVLAITANQGRERIGHLVAQNIDRSVLPNDVSLLSVSIPVCSSNEDASQCEFLANKAIIELKRRGGGPVHIDLSTSYSRDYTVRQLPSVRVINRYTIQDELPLLPKGKIVVFVGSHVLMTQYETEVLDKFCEAHDAVVLCDSTSGYYGKYRMQSALIYGQVGWRSELLNVDVLIHIGEVSGDYDTLKVRPSCVWRVSPDGEMRDTFRRLTSVFEMTESCFFVKYTPSKYTKKSLYLEHFIKEYDSVYQSIPELPFSNIWIAKYTVPKIPAKSVVHLGILNSLRSWNFFSFPEGVCSYSNVGGFGIDGNLSSVIGAALASPHKTFYCILGDLAFFYDLNSLGNRHLPRNIRIMLINNGRGTEFTNAYHPAHEFGKQADSYIAAAGHFGYKSLLLVRHYAEDLGFTYLTASSKNEYQNVCESFICEEKSEKPILFEVFTDSDNESLAIEMLRTCMQNERGDSSVSLLHKVAKKMKSLMKP